MSRELCKPDRGAGRHVERGGGPASAGEKRACARPVLAAACLGVLAATVAGCAAYPAQRTISLYDLECAPAETPQTLRRCVVSDPAALRPLYRPVGKRMGLIQVRTEQDWQRLAAAVSDLGACPDFGRGIVVGLASPAGTRLDGRWPFRWDAVRVREGAGLIEARFSPGNYLPDGTTYLETAHVEGLVAVLVVTVDGIHYLPH